MNKQPLVSIIMPIFNAEPYLEQTLKSVFSQDYQAIEVIAVDDGSTDNSWEILRVYALREPRLKVYRNKKNFGVGYTANLAVQKTKGEFIARVDADDFIPTDRISKQVSYLLTHPDIIIVGGQVELVDIAGRTIAFKSFPENHRDIINLAFLAMPIQQGAMMVNRRLLPKNFVWYRSAYKTSEDLDFFFRAFHYGKGANCQDTVLYYRQHEDSLTHRINPKTIFLQAHRVRRQAAKQNGYLRNWRIKILFYFQFAIVNLLPTSTIYPLYFLWRGFKPVPRISSGVRPLLSYIRSYLF